VRPIESTATSSGNRRSTARRWTTRSCAAPLAVLLGSFGLLAWAGCDNQEATCDFTKELSIVPAAAAPGEMVTVRSAAHACRVGRRVDLSAVFMDASQRSYRLKDRLAVDRAGAATLRFRLPSSAATGPGLVAIDPTTCDDTNSCSGWTADVAVARAR
jgi:hypothetical protein